MRGELKVFAGNANPELCQRISKSIELPLGKRVLSRFPDGEIHVRILENVRGRDVFVIQPTVPNPNESLMELLLLIDALKRASAERVTAVIPCYGYARQDRKDLPRVPISAKLVANLLVAAGADRLLTIDLHAGQIQGFFDIPVDNLYAFPVFQEYVQEVHLDNPTIVSPDVGAMKLASLFCTKLNLPLATVDKRRVGDYEVEATTVIGDVKGKKVILIDDIVSTAGSLTEAAKILRKKGAEEIWAFAVHGLLVGPAIDRIRNSPIQRLVTTDSVRTEIDDRTFELTVLSVAELLGKAIMCIHKNESVSSLFS
ncbi:ribose-phosphate pyrophosphokinase [bacterium]|nr:ribose-phosphate pyrophosphokinase [bacterium]